MHKIITLLAAVVALSVQGLAEDSEINLKGTGFFSGKWDYALNGYDTVSYHSEGTPVEGSTEFQTTYQGATWLFANQENLDAFTANPETYAPAYGGHCAWAAGVRKVAPGDPTVWQIVDGKLYLNYNTSIAEKWGKDIPGFIEAGDAYWAERSSK